MGVDIIKKEVSIVGERIRELRLKHGFTIRQVADGTGLGYQTIANYEYGFRTPNYDSMLALENFFGVSGAYLRGETNNTGTSINKSSFDSMADNQEIEYIMQLYDAAPDDVKKATINFLKAAVEEEDKKKPPL